jgi:hypothetical protein
MKEVFAELGIEVTPDNKQDIDRAIHKLLGVEYKNCSETWKEIKKRRDGNELGFMKELDGVLGKF